MTATISGDGTSTLINLTTSGNTVLGDASTDTLNVGNGGLVKDASGNVGIGTASPTSLGANFKTLELQAGSSSAGGGYYLTGNGTVTAQLGVDTLTSYIGTRTAHPVAFTTSNTERARFDASGNLLVGTTNTDPAGNNVSGVAIRTGAATSIQNGSSTALVLGSSANNTYLQAFRNAGSLAGYISVTGTVTTYNSVSDYRLKKNVQPMTDALVKVAQLKPVTYKWESDNSDEQGFIAHELQAVIPESVQGQKDGIDENGNPLYQGLDTSMIVPYLVAAIQEQQALITTLTDRITALEAK